MQLSWVKIFSLLIVARKKITFGFGSKKKKKQGPQWSFNFPVANLELYLVQGWGPRLCKSYEQDTFCIYSWFMGHLEVTCKSVMCKSNISFQTCFFPWAMKKKGAGRRKIQKAEPIKSCKAKPKCPQHVFKQFKNVVSPRTFEAQKDLSRGHPRTKLSIVLDLHINMILSYLKSNPLCRGQTILYIREPADIYIYLYFRRPRTTADKRGHLFFPLFIHRVDF